MCFPAGPVVFNCAQEEEALRIATRGLRTRYTTVTTAAGRTMCYIKIEDEEDHRQFIVDFVDITICATAATAAEAGVPAGHMHSNQDNNNVHFVNQRNRRIHGDHGEVYNYDDENSPAAQIGRQLAMIGDDINDRYAPQFNSMIRMLQLTPDTAYEAFAGVARKLFRDGHINWGRIITLLCFGYRMAVTVIQRGIHGFFSNIVGFVVRFIINEKIAKWIAEQGGWRAALRYVPETVGWPTIGAIFGIATLSVLTAFFLTRKQ